MATQAQSMSASSAHAARSPRGIFDQVSAVMTQPKAFFRTMPQGRQWVLVAALVLVIFGFAASNQVKSSTDATSSSSTPTGAFDLTLFQTGTAGMQSTDTTSTAAPTAATQTTTTAAAGTNDALMSAMLAACEVLAIWAGQVILLCVIPMLGGRAPKIGRSLQVAVWATLPLALMLVLRQIYFAAGGTGGTVGLTLLLDEWAGYASLPTGAQRLLAAFMSNISVFWLWSLLLLYLGARHALGGRYWSATLLVMIWIVALPAVTALVGEPVTTVLPRTTTSQSSDSSSSDSSSSSSGTSTTIQGGMMQGGSFPSGGQMPSGGGMPPSGGGPGG